MRHSWVLGVCMLLILGGGFFIAFRATDTIVVAVDGVAVAVQRAVEDIIAPKHPALDKKAYDAKMLALANLPPAPAATSTNASSTPPTTPRGPWPVLDAPYPANGAALLPFKRIVAYYGNLYSKQMGILGQYPEDEMLQRLREAVAEWTAADPSTEAIPALDYIAVTAQGSGGFDGKYRARMPFDQIDAVLEMAKKVDGIVILEVQVGLSNVRTEVPLLEAYLKMPQVHLALDPEFDMPGNARPGTVIGTMDADDINFAADYLARLVRDYDLPPKVLVIHRFTQAMLTRAAEIRPLPEVQIVLDADGFGSPAQKINTYKSFVAAEPIQFTGFKLFYKNDPHYGGRIMTPSEVLKLQPQPSFIQYQ